MVESIIWTLSRPWPLSFGAASSTSQTPASVQGRNCRRPARLRRRSRQVELWTLARLAFHPWDAPRRRWRAVDDKDVRRRCRPGRSDRPVLAAAWRFELREALAGAAPPVEPATHWRRLTALLPGCRPPRRYWFPTSRLASFHGTRRAISGAAFTNISPPWVHLTVRANLSWGTASGPEWVISCLPECAGATAAVPQIAADLLHRASRQS
jgi:hypothetical protein